MQLLNCESSERKIQRSLAQHSISLVKIFCTGVTSKKTNKKKVNRVKVGVRTAQWSDMEALQQHLVELVLLNISCSKLGYSEFDVFRASSLCQKKVDWQFSTFIFRKISYSHGSSNRIFIFLFSIHGLFPSSGNLLNYSFFPLPLSIASLKNQ